MILEKNSKILVAHRRLFENDKLRYFFGNVDEYEQGMIKVKGYTWMRDPHTSVFFLKDEERTKILSATSGSYIIYELPDQIDLHKLRSFSKEDGRFFFTDDKDFQMDITEVEYLDNLEINSRVNQSGEKVSHA